MKENQDIEVYEGEIIENESPEIQELSRKDAIEKRTKTTANAGAFLGALWMFGEKMLRVITSFSNNIGETKGEKNAGRNSRCYKRKRRHGRRK